MVLSVSMNIIASEVQSPLLQKENRISIRAADFPVLQEGFELCGRYNLQQFLDQKVEEFIAKNVIYDEEKDAGEYVFDTLTHAIIPAQDLIVLILSKDTACLQRFCTILDEILENNLDLNVNPGFFACKKISYDSDASDDEESNFLSFNRLYRLRTSCSRNIHYCTTFEKFSNHATDQFFQYCIKVSFMNPVIINYIHAYKEKKNIGLLEKTIIKNNSQIMQLLIDKGINIKESKVAVSERFITKELSLFEFAVDIGAHKIIPLLAAVQENNVVQQQLWKSVELNNCVMMQSLINAGANVNAVNEQGATPLHCAARNQYNAGIPLLIAAGANLYAQNKEGKIAWDVVAEKNKDPLELQNTRNLLKPVAALTDKNSYCTMF